ncbi:MAG: phosphate/phosphite/phosphonate ABC transporter substrate-binding protein [Desulfobacterales bacterium]
MNLIVLRLKKYRCGLIVLLMMLPILTQGCGSNQDVTVVDFSKTVPAEQSPDRTSEYPYLRVAVGAMISPKETFTYYRQLMEYIGSRLGRNVQLIQRKTYGEINELLGKGQIDIAFICTGPYVTGKEKYGFDLLAIPEVRKSTFYQSYLIVNKSSSFQQLEDLKGRVFAFTDPDSNTGKMVPTYWLKQMGEHPEDFFDKTIYTYSHDNSILAVARNLVDGAAVDSLIWEYYRQKNPVFTSKTRIIKKSEPYGIPPIVASGNLSSKFKDTIRQLLFSMHLDPEGQKILNGLRIDRIIAATDKWHESIRKIEEKMVILKESTDASAKS